MKNIRTIMLIATVSLLLGGCKLNNKNNTSSSSSIESSESSSSEEQDKGYVKVEKMSMISSDLRSSYAPALGDVKMLVLPIAFSGDTATGYEDNISTWTSTQLQRMYNYYFGDGLSLKNYYSSASFGQMDITGIVSDVYENTTYKVKDILDDESLNTLWDMMNAALDWVVETNTEINWDEYDINNDGFIDNIHLITNYTSWTWADNLWPHMFYTRRPKVDNRLSIDVYSVSGIGHVQDSITSIHEQGHIFGLEDYYDYSYGGNSPIDYIGGLDMQSHNVFDWNSFSKLSTGWLQPYVVTGTAKEAKITIKAASLNGDCIMIPADYSTWNGSAFDEYILIELFGPYGNNKEFWPSYTSRLTTNGGVRMYHVDARVYGSDKLEDFNEELLVVDDLEEQQINSPEDVKKYKYVTKGANNCSDWRDYEGGISQLSNHPLLTIIQRGGEFTFASTKSSDRHLLSNADLFKPNYKFTWDKYSHFFNKDALPQSKTDKGEVFPYEISFSDFNTDSITVTITKVK